jgi:hypothetical protein
MDGICVISPAVIASISIRPNLKQLQTMRLMRGAIDIHLTEMRRDGEPIPSPSTLCDYVDIQ